MVRDRWRVRVIVVLDLVSDVDDADLAGCSLSSAASGE